MKKATVTADDDDGGDDTDKGAKRGVKGEVAHERERWRGRGRLSKIREEVKEELEGEVTEVECSAERRRG